MKRIALMLAALVFSSATNSQEARDIEYASPEEALEALRQNPDAAIETQQGWTIVTLESAEELTLWSFTPESHPAHPAAVKRTIYEDHGSIVLDMAVLCGATKSACDQLVAEFEVLNQQIRQSIDGA